MNCQINEDEVAYIALHIGILSEYQYCIHNKVKCILFYPSYWSLNTKITTKIEKRFKDDILIQNVYDDISNLPNSDDYDLLLSTVHLDNMNPSRYLRISSFLNSNDVISIYNAIIKIKNNRIKSKFEKNLKKFIQK